MNPGLPARIHFVGIGGIGMSGLAKVLLEDGHSISGSDREPSPVALRLAAAGATVQAGHDAANVGDAELVVVSSAIPAQNPEIQVAQARAIPIIKRAELLGRLSSVRRGIAVAGTHGKTTTSSMIAMIMLAGGQDPTILVGGEIVSLGTNARRGAGAWLVTEADEYDGSFLQLQPEIAVVTNVEADHLDFYASLDAIQDAFRRFIGSITGLAVLCADDPFLRAFARAIESPSVTTYGLDEPADWVADSIRRTDQGGSEFRVTRGGLPIGTVTIGLAGRHNVSNALGAVAACLSAGVAFDDAAAALSRFQGVLRRLELKGDINGITVIDDYGHHPTEIRVTLAALRQRYPERRIVCLFQPHTYSRTKHLLDEFANCFTDADLVRVTDIYAARERDEWGVSSANLVARTNHTDVRATGSVEQTAATAFSELRPGDVVLTIGAGDIHRAGTLILRELDRA